MLRFAARLECASTVEAKHRGITEFRELALAVGMSLLGQISENEVYIEDEEIKRGAVLETAELEYAPDHYCMTLEGPLESASALLLDKDTCILQQQGAKSLIVDLGSVHPLGSAGLGVLLNLNDRLDLRLIRVPIKARKMLKMLGLESALSLADSFPDALESLGH